VTAGHDATPFRVSVVRSGSRAVVRITGELDCATAPELESAIKGLLGSDRPRAVVVEADRLTFADVVGLGVLLDAAEKLAPDCRIEVRGAGHQLKRVITLLGHEELIQGP
jgi:anti-anti-sigma factor